MIEVPCAPVGPVGPTSPDPRTKFQEAYVFPSPFILSTKIVIDRELITVITPSIKLLGTALLARRALVPTVKASTLFTTKVFIPPVLILRLLVEVTPI